MSKPMTPPRAAVLAVAALATVSVAVRARNLQPDPTRLASSTYLGGPLFDEATDVAVDERGYLWLSGYTEVAPGSYDAVIVKLTPRGERVVFARRLGGSGFDIALALAPDGHGGVYVVGHTTSQDLPTVRGFQRRLHGPTDVFIARLTRAGALVFSSYYGGSSFENGTAVALDASGAVYFAGTTGSPDLPAAEGVQRRHGGGFEDGFVVRLRPNRLTPEQATYLGGADGEWVSDLAIDALGAVTVVGNTGSRDFPVATALQASYGGGFRDAFVTRLTSDLRELQYSTFLGAGDWDGALGVVVDETGGAYVVGGSSSYNFPLRDPFQGYLAGPRDAFLAALTPDGRELMFSTFLGGPEFDIATSIARGPDGRLHLSIQTASSSFPSLSGQPPGPLDALYARVSPDGWALEDAVRLGGTGFDSGQALAVAPSGDVWVAGRTASTDFPLAHPLQTSLNGSADAFLARLTVVLPLRWVPSPIRR